MSTFNTEFGLPMCQKVQEEVVDDPAEEAAAVPPQKSLSDDWNEYFEYEDKQSEQNEALLNSRKASVSTNIKRAMTLFESSGDRGKLLEKIYLALLTIPPTSVEGHFY